MTKFIGLQIFSFFLVIFLCSKEAVARHTHNENRIHTEIHSGTSSIHDMNLIPSSNPTTPILKMDLDFEQEDPHLIDSTSKRTKRGIIWNKIKKVKKGIWSTKKKLLRIKQRAIEIVIGKDHATPKPHYQSTGGSWGSYEKRVPKRNANGTLPLLSSVHGPPYPSNNILSSNSRNSGSSTKLSYADLLAIYRLPLNTETFQKLQKIRENRSRL